MIEGLCDLNGRIGVLAIDHRDSLRAVMAPDDPGTVSRAAIVELKSDVIEVLGQFATGVMLEPEYSIPDLVDALPPGVGFTAALESQGYSEDPSTVPVELLQGWSAQLAADHGAASAKLLAYISRSAPDHAAAQRAVIASAVEQCRAAGLPLLLEPLAFPGGDHGPDTVDAARMTIDLGADVMKMAWPGEDHLDDLCEVLGDRPWVLLSGGGDFERYVEQVESAMAHGCSGFMAGRAVWREASTCDPSERRSILEHVCRPRLERLREALAVA